MDITSLFKHLSLNEIEGAIDQLKDLYREKFNATYHVITFTNSDGNISLAVQKETGFETNWKGNSGYCGSLNVIVPIEKYSKELEEDIRKKYDSYYTQWVEDGRSYNR